MSTQSDQAAVRRGICAVIGAGPGIGNAVAMAFASEGYDIALIARSPERLAPQCEAIRKKTRRRVRSYAADAGDESSLLAALAAVRDELGAPEVLVYNVATFEIGRPLKVPIDRVMTHFRTNVVGALIAARAVAPDMIERQRGTILFTGGGFAYEPAADYASLSMDKAALRSLTYTLAQDLGAHGVHVATVTVHGFVQHGTRFDPQNIAQAYVNLHRQPKGHFEIETVYK